MNLRVAVASWLIFFTRVSLLKTVIQNEGLMAREGEESRSDEMLNLNKKINDAMKLRINIEGN